jgi:hypothetical protein
MIGNVELGSVLDGDCGGGEHGCQHCDRKRPDLHLDVVEVLLDLNSRLPGFYLQLGSFEVVQLFGVTRAHYSTNSR